MLLSITASTGLVQGWTVPNQRLAGPTTLKQVPFEQSWAYNTVMHQLSMTRYNISPLHCNTTGIYLPYLLRPLTASLLP
jgi:hypothetical protein